ncbi:MAG: hypothetical protein NZ651_01720 [Candidatus Bipolaricaulota bacterium]|nr:hypothetical protein [Candidatus Bipolaricaulota bacterium]MDW8126481.1 hypothetical protein [Candidatus Bipolaricaulota bacterium]
MSYILRGRTRLYQCYTNVNWRTCEACLSWHGRIVHRPEDFPKHDGCPHELLAFPVWRLGEFRRKEERMRAKAAQEISRRETWRRAVELLPQDTPTAFALFKEAVATDLYLAEIEELVGKHREWLAENPGARAALRELLVSGWKGKFAKERYERQPELARTAQERFGLERIKELLP